MKIYRAYICIKKNDGLSIQHKVFGDMNTLEDHISFLRSLYSVKIDRVRVRCEYVGEVNDVD